MHLSEIEGERALEVLADLLEPAAAIFQDPELVPLLRSNASTLKKIQAVLKTRPKEIIAIMAILDEQDPETYRVNPLTLPVKVVALLNEPGMAELFRLQGQPVGEASTGSVQENTGA